MQESTTETTTLAMPIEGLVNQIKVLDQQASELAAKAKTEMMKTIEVGSYIGSLLNEAREQIPSQEWSRWLTATFGEDFKSKAKAYRRAYENDPRQLALELGMVPAKPKSTETPEEAIVKPPAYLGWCNKLTAHFRGLRGLSEADRVAVTDLINQFERLGLCRQEAWPPVKESINR